MMDIQQAIIDNVIYGGNFETIRGLIAELEHRNTVTKESNITREQFTHAVFWSIGEDTFEVAYSPDVMVMNKNGKLHGVAAYDPSVIPTCPDHKFTLGEGSVVLAKGML
jgi:hypothetical protein